MSKQIIRKRKRPKHFQIDQKPIEVQKEQESPPIIQSNQQEIFQEEQISEIPIFQPIQMQIQEPVFTFQKIEQISAAEESKIAQQVDIERLIIQLTQSMDQNLSKEKRSTLLELVDQYLVLSPKDLEQSLRAIKEKLNCLEEVQESLNQKRCSECYKSKKLTAFLTQDTCKDICTICICNFIRKQKQIGVQTNSKLKIYQSLIYQQQNCMVCGKNVNLVSDFTGTVCDDCFMCYKCLLHSYNSKQCQVCHIEILGQFYTQLQNLLFAICSECQQPVNTPCMMQKNCCQQEICGVCQLADSSINCLGCSAHLTSNAISLLNSIRSAIVQMDFQQMEKKTIKLPVPMSGVISASLDLYHMKCNIEFLFQFCCELQMEIQSLKQNRGGFFQAKQEKMIEEVRLKSQINQRNMQKLEKTVKDIQKQASQRSEVVSRKFNQHQRSVIQRLKVSEEAVQQNFFAIQKSVDTKAKKQEKVLDSSVRNMKIEVIEANEAVQKKMEGQKKRILVVLQNLFEDVPVDLQTASEEQARLVQLIKEKRENIGSYNAFNIKESSQTALSFPEQLRHIKFIQQSQSTPILHQVLQEQIHVIEQRQSEQIVAGFQKQHRENLIEYQVLQEKTEQQRIQQQKEQIVENQLWDVKSVILPVQQKKILQDFVQTRYQNLFQQLNEMRLILNLPVVKAQSQTQVFGYIAKFHMIEKQLKKLAKKSEIDRIQTQIHTLQSLISTKLDAYDKSDLQWKIKRAYQQNFQVDTLEAITIGPYQPKQAQKKTIQPLILIKPQTPLQNKQYNQVLQAIRVIQQTLSMKVFRDEFTLFFQNLPAKISNRKESYQIPTQFYQNQSALQTQVINISQKVSNLPNNFTREIQTNIAILKENIQGRLVRVQTVLSQKYEELYNIISQPTDSDQIQNIHVFKGTLLKIQKTQSQFSQILKIQTEKLDSLKAKFDKLMSLQQDSITSPVLKQMINMVKMHQARLNNSQIFLQKLQNEIDQNLANSKFLQSANLDQLQQLKKSLNQLIEKVQDGVLLSNRDIHKFNEIHQILKGKSNKEQIKTKVDKQDLKRLYRTLSFKIHDLSLQLLKKEEEEAKKVEPTISTKRIEAECLACGQDIPQINQKLKSLS